MSTVAFGAVVAAELTKLRTVRSTFWTLLSTFVVSIGFGALLGVSFRSSLPRMPAEQRETFDPLFVAFYGLTHGQLALVVFGVLLVGGEYGSGTIRTSLAAVPRRGLFYAGKLVAGALPVLAVAVATVVVTFLVSQAAFDPHGVSIGAPGVPEAVVGACLYLTLIGLFAMGVATMLRSSLFSLAVLLPILFLGAQGLGNIPKARVVLQYLPDQAGWVMLHLTGPPGSEQFGRDYGAWTGLGILALWTAAALLGGYLVLRRRDA